MSDEKRLKTCEHCGVEYMGGPLSRFCPDCKRMKIAHMDKREAATVKGDGWRHMYRDNTGTVIRAGGNVMNALDDLCAYEEACEAAGIRGPEELGQLLRFLQPEAGNLRKMVEGAKKWEREQKEKATSSGPAGHLPLKGKALDGENETGTRRRRKEGDRFCENCGYFSRIEGTGRGLCAKHEKLLRPEGRGGPLYLVPGQQREVQARRKACGDFLKTNRETDCHGPEGTRNDNEKGPMRARTAPEPRWGSAGSAEGVLGPMWASAPTEAQAMPLGGLPSAPTRETPPEWIGPSAELMPEEGK